MSASAPKSIYGELATALKDSWRLKARPEQLPPDNWTHGWGLLGGRGAGKTWVGSNVTNELAQTVSHIALVGPTAADVRDTMIEGISGILRTAPAWFRPTYEPSKRRVEWPNGSVAIALSSEEPDRARGLNLGFLWADELCAWQNAQETWDMLMFALRAGDQPRWLFSSTPKPIKLLRELMAREGKDVVLTRGSTYDNAANLAPAFLESVRARYAGTRLGRQELEAEMLNDVAGALWKREWIDACRVPHAPAMKRIVVAIDPAVSTNAGSDETGIVVAGLADTGHLYVLEDLSGRYTPDEWARRSVSAYHRWCADKVIGEINNGGAMVESTIRSVEKNIPFKAVHASRGKVVRAEPISALYEQGKVHHLGTGMGELEDQLCSFTSDFDRGRAGYSPDRLDSCVWAITELAAQQYVAPVPVFGSWGRGDGASSPFGGRATSVYDQLMNRIKG